MSLALDAPLVTSPWIFLFEVSVLGGMECVVRFAPCFAVVCAADNSDDVISIFKGGV